MDNQARQLHRRRFLACAGSLAAGLGLQPILSVHAEGVQAPQKRPEAKHVLRFAHMTDMHVQPERAGHKGMIAALHHAQNLGYPPDMIVTGGDTIMDSFSQDDTRTTQLWKLFKKIMSDECSLPVKSCIGNHDVWGWNKAESKTSGSEALWGKKRAVHELGLPNRYYSFDRAGWRFIMLDSTHTDGADGYVAKLNEEQFAWLSAELAQTPDNVHVLVTTHQPILSASVFFNGHNEQSGNWNISAGSVHIDVRRLKDLFKGHPNVKVCISGHMHLLDQVVYCGVRYICDGAVSGAWWKGDHQECDEGYGIVDLYDDGSVSHQYVAFDWKPVG